MNKGLTTLVIVFTVFGLSAADHLFAMKLSDFSKKSSFRNWHAASGAVMNQLPEKIQGRYALSYNAPKFYAGSKNAWPAIIYSAPVSAQDWSKYDILQVDCYLKTINPVSLGVLFHDTDEKRFFEKKSLSQSGQWITLTYKLQKSNINTSEIKTVNFYVTRPSQDIEFYISNIRLVSETPRKLMMLEKAYRRIGRTTTAMAISEVLKQSGTDAAVKADKWFKNLREAQLDQIRQDNAKINPSAKFAVALADATVKIFPKERPVDGKAGKSYEIALARNEYEGFQLLALAPKNQALKDVEVTVGTFKLQANTRVVLPPKAVQAFPVGFVKTRPPAYQIDYVGWYPDPILEHLSKVNVNANEVQPFWVRVKTTSKTIPGTYAGSLTLKTADAGRVKVQVKIKVWDFSIPVKTKLKTATSAYNSPLQPSRDKVYDFLLNRYRLNPFSIYSDHAYGKPTLPPVSVYKTRLKMGLNFIPMLYLKLPRQSLHSSSRGSKKKWAAMPPEQKIYYPEKGKKECMAYLAKLVPEFKQAGIYDIAYCYGFDEAGPAEWPAIVDLCKTIKHKYPDLKIITTAYDPSYGTNSILGEVVTGWIPHDNMYNPELAAKARKNGKEVWWYSTRFFVDADQLWSIRSTMGEDGYKKGVDGFLYWTVTRWNESNKKAITQVPYTNWNPMTYRGHNGGGSFFCAAPNKKILPTLRAEAIRDGIEDYEYLYILQQLSSKLAKNNPLRKQADALLKAPVATGAEKMLERRKIIGNLIEKITGEKPI
jgi:Glycoside hydrolase 123, catalytic domain/Glycoside hydrolase 123, N-terminal domain